jgi:hypothetical protein
MDLAVALMRTTLTHFLDHSEFVEKGTDKYAFVDDLHYALEQYFDENAVPMHITDIHILHSALELEGYNLMYSGVSSSVVQDPNRTGLVIRGFELNLPEEEEEDSEGEEDEEEEEEEELTEAEEELSETGREVEIEIDDDDEEEEEEVEPKERPNRHKRGKDKKEDSKSKKHHSSRKHRK